MTGQRTSEREEKLLEDLTEVLKDIRDGVGIKKIQEAITATIPGTVNVSDRPARQLGIAYGLDGTTPRAIAVDSSGKLRVVTT